MKMKIIMAVLVTASLGYLSCNNDDETTPTDDKSPAGITKEQQQTLIEDSLLTNLLNDSTDLELDSTASFDIAAKADEYYGSIVDYKEVKPCLELYEKTMAKHGIQEDVSTPINLHITKPLKITKRETFRGRELMKFLKKAANKRALLFGKKRKLAIRTAFGIYTKDFVTNRDPSREGRIGVFFITKKYKIDQKTNKWVEYETDDEDDEADDKSFDFGGIHP